MGPTLDVHARAAGKGAPSRRRISSTDVSAVHRLSTGATDADLTPSPLHGIRLTIPTSTITRVWSYFYRP
jgi:hypothetical protein